MKHLQEAIAQAAQALEHARFQEKTALQLCSSGGGGVGGVKNPPSAVAVNAPEDPLALLATSQASIANATVTLEAFLATWLALVVQYPVLRDDSGTLRDYLNYHPALAAARDTSSFVDSVLQRLSLLPLSRE
jgi:hypothetical protein